MEGKKIVVKKESNAKREFDIISGRFEIDHENRVNSEKGKQLINAAKKYWETSLFDPINQSFNDSEIEKSLTRKEQQSL